MGYRMYYCDFERDTEIIADGAEPHEVDEILAMMDRVLPIPGNFLGIMDEHDGMLQFLVHEDGRIGVEIADPPRRGHHGKFASLAECKKLLQSSEGRFHQDLVEGLTFEKW